MSLQAEFGGIVLLYVLAFATGFWLMVSGGALNRPVLVPHVILALAVGALAYYAVSQSSVPPAGSAAAAPVALLVTSLLYDGSLLTGGLLSLQKPMPAAVKSLHLVLSAVSVIGVCATFLLLVPGAR